MKAQSVFCITFFSPLIVSFIINLIKKTYPPSKKKRLYKIICLQKNLTALLNFEKMVTKVLLNLLLSVSWFSVNPQKKIDERKKKIVKVIHDCQVYINSKKKLMHYLTLSIYDFFFSYNGKFALTKKEMNKE